MKPPEEVGKQGSLEWQTCLVGYFIEKRLPFSSFNFIAHKLWDNQGLLEVLANDNGFYFFKFMNDETRNKNFLNLDHGCFRVGQRFLKNGILT